MFVSRLIHRHGRCAVDADVRGNIWCSERHGRIGRLFTFAPQMVQTLDLRPPHKTMAAGGCARQAKIVPDEGRSRGFMRVAQAGSNRLG